jgi:hypothetical protein
MKHYKSNKSYQLIMTGREINELRAMLLDSLMFNEEHNYQHHATRSEKFIKWFDTGQFLIAPFTVKPQMNQYYRDIDKD